MASLGRSPSHIFPFVETCFEYRVQFFQVLDRFFEVARAESRQQETVVVFMPGRAVSFFFVKCRGSILIDGSYPFGIENFTSASTPCIVNVASILELSPSPLALVILQHTGAPEHRALMS